MATDNDINIFKTFQMYYQTKNKCLKRYYKNNFQHDYLFFFFLILTLPADILDYTLNERA